MSGPIAKPDVERDLLDLLAEFEVDLVRLHGEWHDRDDDERLRWVWDTLGALRRKRKDILERAGRNYAAYAATLGA